MGVSNNAILVMGFDVGEDRPEFLGDHCDMDDFLEHSLADSDMTDDERAAEISACPVDVVRHCSYDYPMFIIAVRGTESIANRGYPGVITPESMVVEPERIEAFRAWCQKHGVEGYEEPAWLICTMNG